MDESAIKKITDKLEKGISELFESDQYKSYLKTMSHFHQYSFRNSMLIHLQKPDATYVAGFKAWNKFDRYVNKGETGIRILSPAPYKSIIEEIKRDDNGKAVKDVNGNPITEMVERIVPSYKVTTVFDVSQTSGKDLPEIAQKLSGDVGDYDRMIRSVEMASPVPIKYEEIASAANGYYSHDSKEIVVKRGLSEQQTLKTCIHEIAHSILHDKDTGAVKDDGLTSKDREVQAESVAYTVCQHFGIDTSDYSFGYIASWSSGRDLSELKASMDTIRKTANRLISDIEYNLEQLKIRKTMPLMEDEGVKSEKIKKRVCHGGMGM